MKIVIIRPDCELSPVEINRPLRINDYYCEQGKWYQRVTPDNWDNNRFYVVFPDGRYLFNKITEIL